MANPAFTLSHPHPPVFGPALVVGFATTVAMWAAWFILHLPGVNTPPSVAGPLILGIQLLGITIGCRSQVSHPLIAGVLAGLISGLVNLLILGSLLVEAPSAASPAQAMDGLKPSVAGLMAGYVALSVAIGLLGGAIATATSTPRAIDPARWPARFALVAVFAAVLLLLLGGLVTSSKSGLAVPDWPGTYGANMFLYPIALMNRPQVYLEHTHRLFGALVGLTTLVLMLYIFATDRRRWVKGLVFLLFLAVCAQGLLGGYGVTLRMKPETYKLGQYLGVLHGILAQLFFAGLVGLAAVVSPAMRTTDLTIPPLRRVRPLCFALLAALFVQLAMGALSRQVQNSHALWTHAGFSVVVVALTVLTAFAFSRHASAHADRSPLAARLARAARGLNHVVGFQFVLGCIALAIVLLGTKETPALPPLPDQLDQAPPIPVAASLVRTIHQANGALLLALAVFVTAWTIRLAPSAPALSKE